MTNQTLVDVDLEKVIAENASKATTNQAEEVLAKIERVKSSVPKVYNEDKLGKFLKERANLLSNLTDEYISTAISIEYPLISKDLFTLKREIYLQREGSSFRILKDPKKADPEKKVSNVTIPLFAEVPLFGEHSCILFKKTYSEYYNSHRIKLSAELPGSINSGVTRAYGKALKNYFSIVGGVISNPLLEDLLSTSKIEELIKPEASIIWIPTLDSLGMKTETITKKPKTLDPALILNASGKTYLIKTWLADDEEPLEHYLREYAITDLNGKLDNQKRG